MKLTKEDFYSCTKTKSEPSQCAEGLWVARSAIGVNVDGSPQPIFGFGASFNHDDSQTKSKFELLEHLVFLPYIYTEASASNLVSYSSDEPNAIWMGKKVQDFFIGKTSPLGTFGANGCAIGASREDATTHSRRELLERHLCCEIWYKRCRKIEVLHIDLQLNIINPNLRLDFYTTSILDDDRFALAALECIETGFFAFGAAVKGTIEQASQHAACEVMMLFEDAIRGRTALSSTLKSQQKILSLRNVALSKERKQYLQDLIKNNAKTSAIELSYQSISFEPLPSLFAARTFAINALDPRNFEDSNDVPILPLF